MKSNTAATDQEDFEISTGEALFEFNDAPLEFEMIPSSP